MTMNSEYFIHRGSRDDYGDPLLGISRVDEKAYGIVVLNPIAFLELIDKPSLPSLNGIVLPTREEVYEYTGYEPRFTDENTNQSFIDVFGIGEETDLQGITQAIAEFTSRAIMSARRCSIQPQDNLLQHEYDAIQAADRKISTTDETVSNRSEPGSGYGMYL